MGLAVALKPWKMTLMSLRGKNPASVLYFTAKTKDGGVISLRMDDFGDEYPAWDADGNRYAAFITRWSWGGDRCVAALDRDLAKLSGEVDAMRMMEDLAVLDAAGIDADSLTPVIV